jgi:hypothetical protein
VQTDKHLGFLAWCARLVFLRALEWRLRGTAMTKYSLTNVGVEFTQLQRKRQLKIPSSLEPLTRGSIYSKS